MLSEAQETHAGGSQGDTDGMPILLAVTTGMRRAEILALSGGTTTRGRSAAGTT